MSEKLPPLAERAARLARIKELVLSPAPDAFGYHGTSLRSVLAAIETGHIHGAALPYNRYKKHDLFIYKADADVWPWGNTFTGASSYAETIARTHFVLEQMGFSLEDEALYEELFGDIRERIDWNERQEQTDDAHGAAVWQLIHMARAAVGGVVLSIDPRIKHTRTVTKGVGDEEDFYIRPKDPIRTPGLPLEYINGVYLLGEYELAAIHSL